MAWISEATLSEKTTETRNGGNVNAGNSNQSGQPSGYEVVGVQGQQRH